MTADACSLVGTVAELARVNTDDTPQLSARLVAGEDAAWTEFHRRTFDRMLRYLRTAAHGDEEAAHEALQLAYVKSVRYVRRFESEGAMWAWLAQIARGCLIDRARGKFRYASLLARLDPAPAFSHSTEDAVGDRVDLLAAGLAQLAASERALIEARYTGDQSIAEIALASGTTRKAIESRLARIRNRLRAWLTRASNHER